MEYNTGIRNEAVQVDDILTFQTTEIHVFFFLVFFLLENVSLLVLLKMLVGGFESREPSFLPSPCPYH